MLEQSAIYNGDAFELLKALPDSCIDLILTDPPYNISKPNNFSSMKVKPTNLHFGDWDVGFDQTGWLPDATRVMKPGASIVIWNSFENMGVLAKALENLGLSVKRQLLCLRTNPMPRNRDRLFVSAIQNAIWAVKPGKWTFNRRPGRHFETGIFNYPTQRSKHPTKKPTGMFEEIIEILSNPGDWVLDPFSGIGTTARAAKNLLRNYICFELDKKYYDIAIEELNK
jgi:site-specific DNA-methyltransferase (adenine-specific)